MANFTGWRPTRSGIIYIIVAVLLAVVVFAGAWYVQQRGAQVRQQQATEIAEQNLEEESDTPIIAGEDEGGPAEETPATDGDEEAGPQVATNNDSSNTSEDTPRTNPDTLPATGTDEVVVLLGVTALAFAGSFYLTSRRAARQL